MKLNLNQTDSKVAHGLLAVPMLDVVRFASQTERHTYAARKYADSNTRGERAELMAIALLDAVAYYPRQSGKEYGDLELADGSMVQVKTDGGQLGTSTGTVQDRLVRAYAAIDSDACDWYLLIAKDNKGYTAVTKDELKQALPILFKDSNRDNLRLTINEKRLRQAFPTDYKRV